MFNTNGRRTDGVWQHTGKLTVKSALELVAPEAPPGTPASLVLPNGIITTPMLAPGAAQQLIGSFAQTVSWLLPQSNVWTETPIQVNCLFSGVPTRFTLNLLLGCPTKGQRVAWDLMIDGVRQTSAALGALDSPENNYGSMATGTYYVPNMPAAGTHRVGVALYGPSGSQIFNAIWSTLYVTEERR